MTELRVQVSDDLAARLAAEAAERGTSSEDLVGEVLAEQFPARRRLSFAGSGRSTNGRRAVDDEDMLAEGFGCDTPTLAAAKRRFPFIGIGVGLPGAPSVDEAERMLEDRLDDGFGR